MIALALAACVLGCNPAPVNVAARRLAAVAPGPIRTIAVLPFTEAGVERALRRSPARSRSPSRPARR